MDTPKRQILTGVIALGIAIIAIWMVFFSRVTPPDFSQYAAGPERKSAFFNYFSPIVEEINNEIREDRSKVESVCSEDTTADDALSGIAEKYRVDEAASDAPLCDVLLTRVDVVPASLALAQAANESAWGTSRFAQQGNNFFGQWCFKKGCGIVPKSRGEDQIHEVADFRSPADSVESYMMNLNSHDAYQPLRQIRSTLRKQEKPVTGIALTHGLNKYSERGEEYGEELRQMIRFNKLSEYNTES